MEWQELVEASEEERDPLSETSWEHLWNALKGVVEVVLWPTGVSIRKKGGYQRALTSDEEYALRYHLAAGKRLPKNGKNYPTIYFKD